MATSLTLDAARYENGKHVLTAAGEIDLSNIDAFKHALAAATAESAASGGTFTVDLSAVEYLDSAAINALYARAKHIDTLIANPLLITPLTISGLTELVDTEPAPAQEL